MSDSGLVEVTSPNGERIYCLTNGKSLPQWLEEGKHRKLRKVEEFRSRVELIQNLYFPVSCQKLKYTNDGKFLVATGTYKPRCNIYELRELTIKTERVVDHEIVEFQILSDDWTKMLFLRQDRFLEFHSRTGAGYYSARLPHIGRDMTYDYRSCEVLVGGNSSEIQRLNLEIGSYLKPLQTSQSSLNKCRINPSHGLYAFGGDEGIVEFWDPRVRKPVGFLDAGKSAFELSNGLIESHPQITALEYHSNGLNFGVGTSSGQVMIYDLRSPKVLQTKDHQYGQPIVDLKFHATSKNVISACKKIVKIWNQDTSSLLCSIEPPNDINGFAAKEDSGILFIAGDQPKIHTYYLPFMGPAPEWCCFLDNITLELEKTKEKPVYQDYKFISVEEIEQLGIEKMIGTPYLRAYMHGYFIDIRLYNKIRSIANPEAYSDWRKAKIKEKLAKKVESRITLQKSSTGPKINKDLAEKLLANNTSSEKQEDLLNGRFSSIFTNPAFVMDNSRKTIRRRRDDDDSDKEEEEEKDEESISGEVSEESSDTFTEESSESEEKDEINNITNEKESNSKTKKRKLNEDNKSENKMKLYEANDNQINKISKTDSNLQDVKFSKRVLVESDGRSISDTESLGTFQMTFKMEAVKKEKNEFKEKLKEHRERNPNRRTMKHTLPKIRGIPGSRERARQANKK